MDACSILGSPSLAASNQKSINDALDAGFVRLAPAGSAQVVFENSLNAAIRNIESHPRGEFFQRLIEYGPLNPREDAGTCPGETVLSASSRRTSGIQGARPRSWPAEPRSTRPLAPATPNGGRALRGTGRRAVTSLSIRNPPRRPRWPRDGIPRGDNYLETRRHEDATEFEARLHPSKQVWVHVDFNGYRKAYVRFGMPEIPPGCFLDHAQNRKAIRLRGYSHPYLRLCPVSRRVNTSGGAVSGGEGMEKEHLRSLPGQLEEIRSRVREDAEDVLPGVAPPEPAPRGIPAGKAAARFYSSIANSASSTSRCVSISSYCSSHAPSSSAAKRPLQWKGMDTPAMSR